MSAVATRGAPHVHEGRSAVRVFLLHRSELVLLGMRSLLGGQAWVERCVGTSRVERVVELVRRYEPHVSLLQCANAAEAQRLAAQVRFAAPSSAVVFLCDGWSLTNAATRAFGGFASVTSDMAAASWPELVSRSASGLRPKPGPQLRGGPELTLTERERQILQAVASGATNREIATALLISVDTVKDHLSRSFRKLGVRNRAQAVACARSVGALTGNP